MKSKALYVETAARIVSRAKWSHRSTSASIACLGLAIASCAGFTTVQAQSTHYTVQDLGVVGNNFFQPGQPFMITNNGWVSEGAGGPPQGNGPEHAVLLHSGQMTDIGNPGLGGNSMAWGVNEFGLAVGESEDTAVNLSTTEDFCGFEFLGYTASPTPCVPFFWTGSKMIPLKTLGGMNGVADSINDFGVITGYAENTTTDLTCPVGGSQIYQFKPVVWFGGSVEPLTMNGFDDPDGVAMAINDLGQVVGSVGSCTTFNPSFLFNLQPDRAVLWENGVAVDLGSLPNESGYLAEDINNLGEVVGGSSTEGFLWTRGKGMQGLGHVGDDNFSVGIGINDKGEIVGVSGNFLPDGAIIGIRGVVRQHGKLVDLNLLVVGTNPFPTGGVITTMFGNYPTGLVTACKINSEGEIIGIAVDPAGLTHAYLAKPTP